LCSDCERCRDHPLCCGQSLTALTSRRGLSKPNSRQLAGSTSVSSGERRRCGFSVFTRRAGTGLARQLQRQPELCNCHPLGGSRRLHPGYDSRGPFCDHRFYLSIPRRFESLH
jgi:hypothetical protein